MWRFADLFAEKRMVCGVGYKEPGLLMSELTRCEEEQGIYLLRRGFPGVGYKEPVILKFTKKSYISLGSRQFPGNLQMLSQKSEKSNLYLVV